MSIDLLALLQEKVGGALNNFASSQLGESPSMASKAVSQILPALLGKLAGQTGDASRMTQLFNLVTGPQVDSTLVDIEPSLLDKGRQWLSLLFGDSAGLIQDLFPDHLEVGDPGLELLALRRVLDGELDHLLAAADGARADHGRALHPWRGRGVRLGDRRRDSELRRDRARGPGEPHHRHTLSTLRVRPHRSRHPHGHGERARLRTR